MLTRRCSHVSFWLGVSGMETYVVGAVVVCAEAVTVLVMAYG